MDVIIALAISILGAFFYAMDFCTMFTFVSIALALYKSWIKHTNDKTTRR